MQEAVHEEMMQFIDSALKQGLPVLPQDAQRLGVSYDAMISCRQQVVARAMRRSASEHRRALHKYRKRWEENREVTVFAIAREVHYSPYLLARLFIEELCKVRKSDVISHIKDLSLIKDPRLREEVHYCINNDPDCSPFTDRIGRAIGSDYEVILQRKLACLGVPFETEDTLRDRGLPKTPDVCLQVPLAVQGPGNKMWLVHWIDSKAMFGDREGYLHDVLPQATSYINRYGPGMVIYWFGYLQTLEGHCNDVLLMDHFPDIVIDGALFADTHP